MPSSRDLRRVTDRDERLLEREISDALRALRASVPLARIVRAIRSRDGFALRDLVGTLPLRLRVPVDRLRDAFIRGGQFGLAQLQQHGVAIGIRFDATNPFATEAARQHAADFVKQVDATTRQAIRTVVTRSFAEQITPRDTARLIKPTIGLTDAQATAVLNRRAALLKRGASAERVERAVERYVDQLLNRRALTIARTEIIRASAAGQVESWQQVIAAGRLGVRALKVWVTTPDDRRCRVCRRLNNQRVPVAGGTFMTRTGPVSGPPAHPNCRCAIAVVPDRASVRVRRAA